MELFGGPEELYSIWTLEPPQTTPFGEIHRILWSKKKKLPSVVSRELLQNSKNASIFQLEFSVGLHILKYGILVSKWYFNGKV